MSKRQAGTGLGLALTRRLVQAHGGSIALRSALGKGTEFRVRLPAGVPERVDDTPSRGYTAAAPGRGRVLLIEDDVRAAELIRTYLNNAGYDVMLAGSGETGLTLAANDPPDAIMLDIDLPGIDGWEVLRRLKASDTLSSIPVFFSTVLDERQTGLALGATDYFIKPINHEVLLSQLARHVLPAPGERKTTVLIVEPDDETRRVVTDNLRADGIGVVACGDGTDVPRLASEHHFDLVICDLQAPGRNGFSLLSALDADPATRAIPVLALTGSEMIGIAGPQHANVVGTAPDFASVGDSLANWRLLTSGRSTAGSTDEGRGRR
jgi:DNA-binding response OmpR family regulator